MKLSQITEHNASIKNHTNAIGKVETEKWNTLLMELIECIGDQKIPFLLPSESHLIRVNICDGTVWICSNLENSFTVKVSDYTTEYYLEVKRSGNELVSKKVSKDTFESFKAICSKNKYQYA